MSISRNPLVDWSRAEWVLLDMDGTVLDLAYDNWFWRELLPARYAERRQLPLDAARAELEPQFRSVMHTLPWYCTDHWSRVTGLDVAALKRESRDRVAVLPGALDFLRAVRASGRRLWLATNAHRDSWTVKLERTGLLGEFEHVICSHDYGAPKESATFWQAARARYGFDPARSLFVDDSLPVCRAARDFGIGQVVLLSHPDSAQPPREVSGFTTAPRLADLSWPEAP
jgi:5'-nucleotidase